MNLKNMLKIIGVILIFVILQSYFINPDNLTNIIGKWKDYFMTIIMSIFIAILLEPIVKYLKKKSKINDILAISLSIIFVILVFIILSLIVIPEIISSLKVLNDIYPYISEKAITIGKNIANYLAEKNIYTINMDEVNKYVSEKLNRDKEITFSYKINKTNNTLEGYSEEGKLVAVNSLKDEPAVAQMAGMKTKISEKNGKLNPVSEIYLANGQLAVRNTYKFNRDTNIFATDAVIAYVNGEIPYSADLKAFLDGIDRIQVETFENNKLVLYTTYELNHKSQQITVKNGLSANATITKAVLSINGLNGTMETYYENGKINQKVAIKNGLFNGKVEKFSDKSGKLLGTGVMKDGLPDGEFVEYDEAGKVISKVKYKDGKEIK